jgi:hypothetical protein
MITTSEKATQKSITLPTLSVHHIASCGRCATRSSSPPPTSSWPRTVRACPSPRSPTLVPAPEDARGSDASRSRGRGGRSPLGQPFQRLGSRLQGGDQKRRVVAVGGSSNGPQRDTLGVDSHRATPSRTEQLIGAEGCMPGRPPGPVRQIRFAKPPPEGDEIQRVSHPPKVVER